MILGMTVLRFRLENHKSFRDPTEIALVRPGRTEADESWTERSLTLAAIYGANASGKSSIIDGLRLMIATLRHSATSWRTRSSLPHSPFKLDDLSRTRPSSYGLDVVIRGIRYEYGFSMLSDRIVDEWLFDYPVGRRRLLFERSSKTGGDKYRFGRSLKGGTASLERLTSPQELVLSRAANDGHPTLESIHSAIVEKFEFAEFTDASRQQRLQSIVEDLTTHVIELEDIAVLLRAADVGISHVRVAEEKTPPEVLSLLRAIQTATRNQGSQHKSKQRHTFAKTDEPETDSKVSFVIDEVTKGLRFNHAGTDGSTYELKAGDQSTGTLSWLSLAVPAINALRSGTALLIDELDASLHPQLALLLIQMFSDKELNKRHGQLIFTTHDTFFISPSSDQQLNPEEVWLVEKKYDGSSEIFSLSDFPVRSDHNFSRRYLQGRYGGVPSVAPAFLYKLFQANPNLGSAE